VASVAELAESVAKARDSGVRIELDLVHAGRRAVFVRDPDGCLLQLYADEGGEPALDAIDPDIALYVF